LEDAWLGDTPLANHYPTLYNIVRTKDVLVVDVFSQVPLNMRFNRLIIGEKWDAWVHLVSRIMNMHLNDEHNSFKWHMPFIGTFSVKSMYADYEWAYSVSKKRPVKNKDPTEYTDFYVCPIQKNGDFN
jgi:hypothetical protein